MARDRSLDEDQDHIRETLEYFQVFDLYPFATGAAGHTHALKYLGGERRCANGAGSALTVVLAVGCVVDTAETVAFHNSLEAFTFGRANGAYEVTFSEDFFNFDEVAK